MSVDWGSGSGGSGQGIVDSMEGMDDIFDDSEEEVGMELSTEQQLKKELQRLVGAYSLPRMFVHPNMNPLELLKMLKNIIKQRERRFAHMELPVEIEEMQKRLLKIVQDHGLPDTMVSEDMHILTLLNIVEDIIQRLERKLAVLDLSFEGTNLLEGTTLQIKIDETRKKISDLLESYQKRVMDAEQNYWMLEKQIIELTDLLKENEKRNYDLRNALILLRRSNRIPEEVVPYDHYFRKLEEHLESDFRMHSSFMEELSEEKRQKHELIKEVCKAQQLRAEEQLEKQMEIAELARDLQLEDGLRERILEKITDLSSNRYEVNQAVNDWMKDIRACIDPKKEEIAAKAQEYVNLEDEMKKEIESCRRLAAQLEELRQKKKEVKKELTKKDGEVILMQKRVRQLDQEMNSLKSYSEILSPSVYYDARSRLGSITSPQISEGFPTPRKHRFGSGIHRIPLPLRVGYPSSEKIAQFRQRFESIGESDEWESPEKFVKGSPYRVVTYFDDSNSFSIHTTPRSAALPYIVTPPSPFYAHDPLIQSIGENETAGGALGTITIPGPSSRFAPRTATISSPTLSHVTNRFDIGKSFNLRTVCQTSTPYHQVTRVESSIPKSGYSGDMINSPLNITHSAEITPTQYESPLVPKSRFGYTDPTAEVLNIPPGLVIPVPAQTQETSPDVVTYGIPPAVTPTSTRRHGIFTPKGIFRKKHYNIRRLYEPEYYQSPQLEGSPQYPPQDARSPIKSDSPLFSGRNILRKSPYCSPCDSYKINKTFEISPILDQSLEGADYNAIDRTFDISTPSDLGRTFDATSPKTTYREYDQIGSQAINRTFDVSPPFETQDNYFPEAINRTFDASPQYILSRTFDASPQHNLNTTYDASSPVNLNRTFEVAAPVNKTFETSPTALQNRTFEVSHPNNLDSTFDSSPHVLNRTFQLSPAPQSQNETFDATLESLLHVPYRRPIHPNRTSALNRTFSPNRTFDTS